MTPSLDTSDGGFVQLTCIVVSGDLPIHFSWLLDGHSLTSSDSVSIVNVAQQTGLLIMRQVTLEQAGKYTCRVNNSAGVSEVEAEVRVKGMRLRFDHPFNFFAFCTLSLSLGFICLLNIACFAFMYLTKIVCRIVYCFRQVVLLSGLC